MSDENPPITLLRIAAFVTDALSLALVLIVPASLISYASAWLGTSTRAVNYIWWGAFAIFCAGILIRDGLRHGSPGKRLFGLRLVLEGGGRCSFAGSIVRNLPLLVPGWNFIEVVMVLFTRNSRRSGDRLAKTTVSEE